MPKIKQITSRNYLSASGRAPLISGHSLDIEWTRIFLAIDVYSFDAYKYSRQQVLLNVNFISYHMETFRKFERPNSRMERSLFQTLILFSGHFSKQFQSLQSVSDQSKEHLCTNKMGDDVCHYDVQQNDKYGRYLVANKDLVSGELIFTDTPFAFGPKPGKCLRSIYQHLKEFTSNFITNQSI